MAQLLGIIAIGLGLFLLVQLVRLFAEGRWKVGVIGIGTTIGAYIVWGHSLPVFVLASDGADSIGPMLVISQLSLVFTFLTGLLTLYYLRERRYQSGSTVPPEPARQQAPARMVKESKLDGRPLHCPNCGQDWTAPPDECPKCGTSMLSS